MQLDCLEQLDGPFGLEDPTRVKIRHRVRQMLADFPAEENKALLFKGKSNDFSCFVTQRQLFKGDVI